MVAAGSATSTLVLSTLYYYSYSYFEPRAVVEAFSKGCARRVLLRVATL